MQATGNNFPLHPKSIRLCMDGLSFFQEDSWKRIDFVSGDTFLQKTLAKCLCTSALTDNSSAIVQATTPYTTFVPSDLLQQQEALELFRFVFPEANSKDYVVFKQPLQSFDITLLFALPTAHYHLIHQLFDKVHWQHDIAYQVEKSLKISKKNGEEHAWLVQNGTHTHLSVAKNGALLFSNHFETPAKEDVLFYCAQVYEQYALSQQHTPLYIKGDASLHQLLQQHIVHCQLTDTHANC